MSNEYKRLKEELDSADLKAILPGFDREDSWKELSPRLKKTQNKAYAWRYAAALVAIVIVALLIRLQINHKDDGQVATTIPSTTKHVTVDTHTIAAKPKAESIPGQPAIAKKKTVSPKSTPIPARVQEESTTTPVEEHIVATEPELIHVPPQEQIETPVATTKIPVKRPKAIHLLDIDNENRQAAIQNRNELQGLPQRIVNLLPGRQYSNTDNERKPASLFKVN